MYSLLYVTTNWHVTVLAGSCVICNLACLPFLSQPLLLMDVGFIPVCTKCRILHCNPIEWDVKGYEHSYTPLSIVMGFLPGRHGQRGINSHSP